MPNRNLKSEIVAAKDRINAITQIIFFNMESERERARERQRQRKNIENKVLNELEAK